MNRTGSQPKQKGDIKKLKSNIQGRIRDTNEESVNTISRLIFSAEMRRRKCEHKWKKIQKQAKR